ncbi:hypothetical protein ACN6KF_003015 [Labrys sp. La1]|uniref:hypothetical protein n=1 Tax=Labrys sp. La1 TaxID=3404917 RepID=UPI003EBD2DC6
MSKRVSASPEERARRIKRVVKAGFDYVQFSEHHFRFEGVVDFWPSSDHWNALATKETGYSTASLIAYLKKRFPELVETAA